MALSWRRRDGKHDLRTREGKVLIRDISVQEEAVGLIIGSRGTNIKRMENLEGVITISVDSKQCKVSVRAYTNLALDSVENDVRSLMAKVKIMTILKKVLKLPKNTTALRIHDHTCGKECIFKSTPDCIFEVLRFCSLFGVDPKHIQEGVSVSVNDIGTNKLPEILDFMEHWNTNMLLLDNEIIWNRKRHLIHSNFIQRLLVTTNFMRSWDSYYLKLNRLRCFPGIDYVEIDCDEEDVIMQLVIGARSKSELDSCVAQAQSNFNSYLDSLKVHRFIGREEKKNGGYFSCIPYACASYKLYKKSQFSGLSYLEVIFSDPEVILVELNEIEQTLTLGCSSQEKLNLLLFEVRGKMSFYKAFAWRKNYHGNFKCYIKASDDQIKMDAIFEDFLNNEIPFLSADFTDVIDDSNCLKSIKLLESSRTFQDLKLDSNSKSSYALFNESEILSEFCRFVKFVDLPILHNVHVYTTFGVTLYKMKSRGTKRRISAVSELLNQWEKCFQGHFSFDLKPSLKEIFFKCLVAEGFIELSHQYFTDVFFSDLGNNFRFTARIENTVPPSKTFDVKYCKTGHLDVRVIDVNSSKCSTQIMVSSQKTCDSSYAKEFVQEAMESGELMKENAMSLNSRYSMYNVSIVNRTVFQYRDFIIHLDSVSKKSNQRYGRFSDTVHLTLHCPCLNEAICELQKNSGDESLKISTVELYERFVSAGEHFSGVIDKHF